ARGAEWRRRGRRISRGGASRSALLPLLEVEPWRSLSTLTRFGKRLSQKKQNLSRSKYLVKSLIFRPRFRRASCSRRCAIKRTIAAALVSRWRLTSTTSSCSSALIAWSDGSIVASKPCRSCRFLLISLACTCLPLRVATEKRETQRPPRRGRSRRSKVNPRRLGINRGGFLARVRHRPENGVARRFFYLAAFFGVGKGFVSPERLRQCDCVSATQEWQRRRHDAQDY